MFQLDARHTEIFDQSFLKKYKEELVDYLLETYPEAFEGKKQAEVELFVETGIERAQEYEITIESEITEFVERMVLYGEHFDRSPQYPWIARILNDPDIDGNARMARISLIEMDEDFNAATGGAD